MTYDPVSDYVTEMLMGIRRGNEAFAREAARILAAMVGIPAAIGLIYWFL